MDSSSWLPTMCEQFNDAHPEWNITFTYEVCSEGDASKNVTQDVSAAADVYMFANDQLGTLVQANAIAQLGGSYLDEVLNDNPDTMIDSVTSTDGGVYGVPFTGNTWFMYYDTSVFSEDDVKSLDTMLEKGKVAFPLTDSWYIASFYYANGCTIFGESGMDAAAGFDFGGDKAVAVTKYLVNLYNNANFSVDADGSGLSGLREGTVNAIFSGTWNAEPDTITWYDLQNSLTVWNVTGPGQPTEGTTTGLYDLDKLKVYDKYAMFLHGNNGLSRVEGDGEGKILVIKDSYANSFVPYLTANYGAIDVVDFRNYNYGLDQLIAANDYDQILVLYSYASFTTDPYLYRAGVAG